MLFGPNKKNVTMNGLDIKYSNGQIIKYNDFKKSFTDTRTITVKNNSDESKTFSLEWIEVENALEKQNKFTYEIKCTGDRCAELGKSQVPIASSNVYPQVLIEANKTQVYTIKFNFEGKEDKANFKGTLRVYSKKTKAKDDELELDEIEEPKVEEKDHSV